MKTIKLTIDNHEVEAPEGATIIQAAMQAGVEVPHFCFHPRLKIAGNCRMCLVEIDKQPKLAASCAMPAVDGMVVYTNSEKVKKGREGVLEFLLINHPLDCPICDQGGECDLQDLTLNYGRDRGRFREGKRAVAPKNMGPIIKTYMNRCIHCTRCVRFAEDVAGMPELGTLHRGEDMEITTYLNRAVETELSGNMVDLCPVGALTSAPYAFRGRPWELRHTHSIDIMDAMGSHVRLDTFANSIMRVLPRPCESINQDWITDKARFAFEGLGYQRLTQPMLRQGSAFSVLTWDEAYKIGAMKLVQGDAAKKAALVGDLVDVEGLYALKHLWESVKSPHIDARQNGSLVSYKHRSHYLFNSSFAGVDEADLVLVIGDDLRSAAPLLHARLLGASLDHATPIYHIGSERIRALAYEFPYTYLGSTTDILIQLLAQKAGLARTIRQAKRPMMIVCEDALRCEESLSIQALCHHVCKSLGFVKKQDDGVIWNGYNVLTSSASRTAALDFGLVPKTKGLDSLAIIKAVESGHLDALLLVGADEIDMMPSSKTFVIYVGHHGDRGAQIADLILPCAAWSEKDSTHVNMEGRIQQAHAAITPPENLPAEWQILSAIDKRISSFSGWSSREVLYEDIRKNYPRYALNDTLPCEAFEALPSQTSYENIDLTNHEASQEWYYLTNPLARNAKTMRACQKQHLEMKEGDSHA